MIIGISGKAQSGKDTTASLIQWLMGKRTPPLPLVIDNYDAFLQQEPTWKVAYSGWEIRKFFDKPKEMAAILIGCTVEELESGSFKERLMLEWGMTPRSILQLLGDKLKQIHPRAVINSLMSDYKIIGGYKTEGTAIKGMEFTLKDGSKSVVETDIPMPQLDKDNSVYPNWIVPDVRFPEEARAIKDRGGIVIRIHRNVNQRMPLRWREFEKIAEHGNFFEYMKAVHPETYKTMYHESEIALDNYHGFNASITNNSTLEELEKQIEVILLKHKLLKYEPH